MVLFAEQIRLLHLHQHKNRRKTPPEGAALRGGIIYSTPGFGLCSWLRCSPNRLLRLPASTGNTPGSAPTRCQCPDHVYSPEQRRPPQRQGRGRLPHRGGWKLEEIALLKDLCCGEEVIRLNWATQR